MYYFRQLLVSLIEMFILVSGGSLRIKLEQVACHYVTVNLLQIVFPHPHPHLLSQSHLSLVIWTIFVADFLVVVMAKKNVVVTPGKLHLTYLITPTMIPTIMTPTMTTMTMTTPRQVLSKSQAKTIWGPQNLQKARKFCKPQTLFA